MKTKLVLNVREKGEFILPVCKVKGQPLLSGLGQWSQESSSSEALGNMQALPLLLNLIGFTKQKKKQYTCNRCMSMQKKKPLGYIILLYIILYIYTIYGWKWSVIHFFKMGLWFLKNAPSLRKTHFTLTVYSKMWVSMWTWTCTHMSSYLSSIIHFWLLIWD